MQGEDRSWYQGDKSKEIIGKNKPGTGRKGKWGVALQGI